METRALTALDRRIAVIGTGTWQLGLDQGEVAPETAAAALDAVADLAASLTQTVPEHRPAVATLSDLEAALPFGD